MSGAPCKHQGAVAINFHIAIFNFIPSLTPNDRTIYAYITFGYVAKNNSFYASLRGNPALQDQELMSSSSSFINNLGEITDQRESSEGNEDITGFNTFLEDIKMDYQNAGQTLRTALDKFKERYNAAKSKSISRLTSFLYDLNRSLDPMRVKSGAQIRVQVESVEQHKTEGGSTRRRLPVSTNENKENSDPHIIPPEKKGKSEERS